MVVINALIYKEKDKYVAEGYETPQIMTIEGTEEKTKKVFLDMCGVVKEIAIEKENPDLFLNMERASKRSKRCESILQKIILSEKSIKPDIKSVPNLPNLEVHFYKEGDL